MFFFCKYAWNPIAPSPILLSLAALNLAFSRESGALSMKKVSTLSKNLIRSEIKYSSSCHSSNFSKFTLDRQHTAVLSSLVGRVISEQRLL